MQQQTLEASIPAPDAAPGAVTSVLVVDDHRMVAEAIRLRLEAVTPPHRTFGPVETAYSLEEARTCLARWRPDLVLLDYRLGEACGLDLIPALKGLSAPPVTLMFAAASDPERVIEAMCHAEGWISKGLPFQDLVDAIEEVLCGRAYLSPHLLRPVLDQLLSQAGHATRRTTFLDVLSERERQVLDCLVSGMSRQEIGERLYISTNTVRTHVQNLLRHAELHSTLALIAAARDLGVTGSDAPLG